MYETRSGLRGKHFNRHTSHILPLLPNVCIILNTKCLHKAHKGTDHGYLLRLKDDSYHYTLTSVTSNVYIGTNSARWLWSDYFH